MRSASNFSASNHSWYIRTIPCRAPLPKNSVVRPEKSSQVFISFELQPDGTTLMKTWEEFSGLTTLFFGNGARQGIVRMYQEWFDALKFEAERIARDEQARG